MKTKTILIETPAFVEIEGTEVLTLIAREENCVRYGIVGFNEEPINLVDHRQKGLEAIDVVLKDNRVEKFPMNFCFPAQLRISQMDSEILIELFDLQDDFEPELMLWIATDLEEPIPDYKYFFFRIKRLIGSYYSFVSLFNYHRFQPYFDGMADQKVLLIQVENQI